MEIEGKELEFEQKAQNEDDFIQDKKRESSDEEEEEDQPQDVKEASQVNVKAPTEQNEQNKKKKKKKKKKRELVEEETDYEIDVPSKAKQSLLLRCDSIPEHMRMRYALLEQNPWLLIVSNFSPYVTSYEIKDFFNTLISKLRPEYSIPPPVINVEIATNKQFSTLEFTAKEPKQYALTLKGIELQKCKLTIEKPRQYFFRNYLENARMEDVQIDCEEGGIQVQMNKVYMGGLPTYLKDADVRKLCETFGKLKYFNVAKQQNESKEQVSKGYCFFEYEDSTITDKAIKALNGLPCGDRKLKVSRVTKDQNKLANSQLIQSEKGKHAPSNNSGSFLGGCEHIKRDDIVKMLTIPEFAYMPSRVIQLLNMVSIEDLFEDDIVEELQSEVMAECVKIGPVEKIEIPKPDKETGSCPPSIGKVFVKFMYMTKAKKARHVLAGRTYNKRTVIASFYPEEKFERKDYLFTIQ